MPTAIAYRRAPLVDPALVPLSDAAVHADGLQKQLTDLALGLVDLNRMSPLDAALATKLGGYTETPPFPDVEAAAGLLPARSGGGVEQFTAGEVSIRTGGGGDLCQLAAAFRRQAADLMAPFWGDDGFAFLGVRG